MIEAWLSASEMIASSAPSSGLEQAAVGVEAGGEEDRVVLAEPAGDALLELRDAASCAPQMKRTEAMPKPNSSSASRAAATTSG